MGRKFKLRIYHNGLKYFFGQLTLNDRKRRQLEFLSEYEFDIKHVKGKENKMADALSRRVHEMHATTISMYQIDLKGRIYEARKDDLQYMELVTKLQQGKMQQKVEIMNWEMMEFSYTGTKFMYPILMNLGVRF